MISASVTGTVRMALLANLVICVKPGHWNRPPGYLYYDESVAAGVNFRAIARFGGVWPEARRMVGDGSSALVFLGELR